MKLGENKKIWIDLDNSPHVPFFKPIIEELDKHGFEVVITARDCFQVCDLSDLLQVKYKRIGRHYGKNRIMKGVGLAMRALQLAPTALREKPCLALSHGSRSQLIIANFLRIPTALIFDYEHAEWVPFAYPDCVILPDIIPDSAIRHRVKQVCRYDGIKEDVYVPAFEPKPGLLAELGVGEDDLVVTIRPPATEAHYHRPESDQLFNFVVEYVAARHGSRIILLPRNRYQEAAARQVWPDLFERRKIVTPRKILDGLNLIWYSDLVISGGGTMNREAAALGVPVYSIFRGETGMVDKYLSESGRLVLLTSSEDIQNKLKLEKWNRPDRVGKTASYALRGIVDSLLSIVEGTEAGPTK
jgi:predicted glycosyltransferase